MVSERLGLVVGQAMDEKQRRLGGEGLGPLLSRKQPWKVLDRKGTSFEHRQVLKLL